MSVSFQAAGAPKIGLIWLCREADTYILAADSMPGDWRMTEHQSNPPVDDIASRAVHLDAPVAPWSERGTDTAGGKTERTIEEHRRVQSLQAWLERWGGVARSAVSRRRDLVRMGLEVQHSWKRSSHRRVKVGAMARRTGEGPGREKERKDEAERHLAALSAMPHRAARFLDALAEEPELRAVLLNRGMTEEDIREGAALIGACLRNLGAGGDAGRDGDAGDERERIRRLYALRRWFERWARAARRWIGGAAGILRLGVGKD